MIEYGFRTRKIDLYDLIGSEVEKLEGILNFKIS
jgi:hypothetical protein